MEQENTKKKLLLLTDTPVITTGLGRICNELAKRFLKNYDVAIAGWHHKPLRYNLPYFVYPLIKNSDEQSINTILYDYKPDILLAIGDIWDFSYLIGPQQNYRDKVNNNFKSILWVTVDGEWINPHWGNVIRSFDNIVSFSKFGLNEIKKYSKHNFEYIYPGVDTEIFYPYDINHKWDTSSIDIKNTFVGTIIGQNHDRKNIPMALDIFSEFAKDKEDVFLFLATNPNSQFGNDIFTIIKNNNLINKVAVVKNVNYFSGVKDSQINLLYNMATVIINTSIGEGLGLPLLEAQAANCIPICTNYAAGAEIIEDRGKLIDIAAKVYGEYDVKRAIISPKSLLNIFNELYQDWKSGKKVINDLNRKGLEFAKSLTWDSSVSSLNNIIENTINIEKKNFVKEKIEIKEDLSILQVIPSWGKNCGIAEYTKELGVVLESKNQKVSIFPSNDYINLFNVINEKKYNVVVFQHEYSFWQDRFVLQDLLIKLKKANVKTVIEMHTYSPLSTYNNIILEYADEIIIHCDRFKEQLIAGNQYKNVNVINLACKDKIETIDNEGTKKNIGLVNASPIIGSFGFLRDQKGYQDIILAVRELSKEYPNIKMLLVCPKHEFGSLTYDNSFIRYIEDIGMQDKIILVRDYLKETELLKILSCTDIFALNYKESPAGGGNSAAIKTLLRTSKPIITSDTFYFADMNSEVLKVKKMNVANIMQAIKDVYKYKDLAEDLVENGNKYLVNNSWDRLIEKHIEIYGGKNER